MSDFSQSAIHLAYALDFENPNFDPPALAVVGALTSTLCGRRRHETYEFSSLLAREPIEGRPIFLETKAKMRNPVL
jgi:hypothetical protein